MLTFCEYPGGGSRVFWCLLQRMYRAILRVRIC